MSKHENSNDFEKLFREGGDNKESDKLIGTNDSITENLENVEQIKRLKQLQKNLLLENKNNVTKIDSNLLNEIHKITSELLNKPANDTNNNNNNNKTSNNIYNNDLDNTTLSDKDVELESLITENKRFEDPRERLRTSFNNCSAWLLANDLENNENNEKNLDEQPGISSQSKFNTFNPPDLTKPPPPLYLNQLPSITNQQAQMFSNILQQSANNVSTINIDSKLPSPAIKIEMQQSAPLNSSINNDGKETNNNFGYEEHQNKRFKRSRSEEKSESSSSSMQVTTANNAALLSQSNIKREDLERNRRKKALPPIKENHLSICSKTVWIGHLAKTTTENDLKEIVESYGPIIDVHMIPPRGCAYIQFSERRDAVKCLDRLKDSRIQGSLVKIQWARNMSIKDNLKNYWNVVHGCTYIPWKELNSFDNLNFLNLSNGGFIDEETIPENLINLYNEQMNKTTKTSSTNESEPTTPSVNSFQQLNSQKEVSKEELTPITTTVHNLDNMKDLFDPSRPPPLIQFPQQDIQQPPILLQQLQAQPNGLQLQQFLLSENEMMQSQQQQQQQYHHHHHHQGHNIGLIHSQQPNPNPACFLNQIRCPIPPPPPPPSSSSSSATTAAAFATGSQLHQLQNHQPGAPNIHLMSVLTSAHLQSTVTQSHLKNQISTQQPPISHGISGLPLQVLPGSMFGPQSTGLDHQTRPSFHLSPHVQFIQRPFITQQGHLIQGGLIRQLIPGTLLQQFQQPDINELNVNENNGLNNTNQVQLVALANRSLTPTNPIQNIQIRHLNPTNSAQLQPPTSVLSTPLHHQQHLGQDRQFNNNSTINNNNNDINYKKPDQIQPLNQNYQQKLNQTNIETQLFNESLIFNDANRLNIPCLMNMNFNPTNPQTNQIDINNFSNLENNNNNNNNSNDISNPIFNNRNQFDNNNFNNEDLNNKRKTSRFDREFNTMILKPHAPIEQYKPNLNQIIQSNFQQPKNDFPNNNNNNNNNNNQNDRNRSIDYSRQRNNNFINKKTFNNNNGWNKTWRNNNYQINKYQNSRNVNINNNFNETFQHQLITSNSSINNNYAANDSNNIEDMCTSDDDNHNNSNNSNNNRNNSNENEVSNENNDNS